jgi:hypothetical protein
MFRLQRREVPKKRIEYLLPCSFESFHHQAFRPKTVCCKILESHCIRRMPDCTAVDVLIIDCKISIRVEKVGVHQTVTWIAWKLQSSGIKTMKKLANLAIASDILSPALTSKSSAFTSAVRVGNMVISWRHLYIVFRLATHGDADFLRVMQKCTKFSGR